MCFVFWYKEFVSTKNIIAVFIVSFVMNKSCCNSGFPFKNNVEGYVENREKNVHKGRGSDFKLAVQEIDAFLKDPKANISISISLL